MIYCTYGSEQKLNWFYHNQCVTLAPGTTGVYPIFRHRKTSSTCSEKRKSGWYTPHPWLASWLANIIEYQNDVWISIGNLIDLQSCLSISMFDVWISIGNWSSFIHAWVWDDHRTKNHDIPTILLLPSRENSPWDQRSPQKIPWIAMNSSNFPKIPWFFFHRTPH